MSVQVDVSGQLGTATQKRVLLPSSFFETSSKPLLVHDKREAPIYMDYPSEVQDAVTIELPKTFAIESLPKDASLPLPNMAIYRTKYLSKGNVLSCGRALVVADFVFPPTSYNDLRSFFQKLNAQDREQVVLKRDAAAEGQ